MVPGVVVKLVEELKEFMPIGEMQLGVGRSSYYRWKKNIGVETAKNQRDKLIGQLCHQHKFRYGYRKITKVLPKEFATSEKTVQRVMQKYG